MSKRLEAKVDRLNLLVGSIRGVLYRVQDCINAERFDDARAELSEVSNETDYAMGLIDELMAPEPTREDLVP